MTECESIAGLSRRGFARLAAIGGTPRLWGEWVSAAAVPVVGSLANDGTSAGNVSVEADILLIP